MFFFSSFSFLLLVFVLVFLFFSSLSISRFFSLFCSATDKTITIPEHAKGEVKRVRPRLLVCSLCMCEHAIACVCIHAQIQLVFNVNRITVCILRFPLLLLSLYIFRCCFFIVFFIFAVSASDVASSALSNFLCPVWLFVFSSSPCSVRHCYSEDNASFSGSGGLAISSSLFLCMCVSVSTFLSSVCMYLYVCMYIS